MICIHVERAFPPEQGPLSRANFGRAFFRAGHVVMGLGLAVLLVGRLAGRFYEPLLADWGWFAMPEVATQANLKLLALLLALGATYSYVDSQAVVSLRGSHHSIQRRWAFAAEILATMLLAVSVGVVFGLIEMNAQTPPHLWPTIFFAEAAICLGLASRPHSSDRTSRLAPAVLAAISACAATWQLLLLLGVTQYVFLLATTCFGLVCLAVSALTLLQRGEALLTAIGLIVLAVGYWGWYREKDQREALVSFNLALGSRLQRRATDPGDAGTAVRRHHG